MTTPDLLRILLPDDEHSNSGGDDDHCSPLVLLIEDADQCLISRMTDNLPAISTLLNLADGILGRCLDVRVIATSNAKVVDVDKALLRPGRICPGTGVINLPELPGEQAKLVLERLGVPGGRGLPGGHALGCPMTLASLYRIATKGSHKP